MYIKFHSKFNYDHLSVAGQDIIFALDDNNINIIPELNGIGAGLDIYRFNRLKKLSEKKQSGDFINIILDMPEFAIPSDKANLNILWTDCDTLYVPPKWIEKCSQFDAVFVPSFFCKKSLLDSGYDKDIFVIPYPFDSKRFIFEDYDSKLDQNYKFVYMDSWKRCNGYRELLEAYFSEFSLKDKVALNLVSTSNTDIIRKSVIEIASKTGLPFNMLPYVEWYSDIILHSFISSFLKKFDCLVLPHYGKSFGLTIVNAMSVGMPIITTDFGGVQEHCRGNTCNLIDSSVETIEEDIEGAWYKKGMTWGRPNINSLRACLRNCYEQKNTKDKLKAANEIVNRRYNYKIVANKIKDALNTITTGVWDNLNVEV